MEKINSILTVLFCGFIVYACSLPQNNKKEPRALLDDINGTLEGLKDVIPDPLTFSEPINITLPDDLADLISGEIGISDLNIGKLNSFLIPYLDLQVAKFLLTFTVVFPFINIDAHYIADINLLNILPIYGNGSASIVLNDLQIKGNASLDLSSLSIKDLNLQIELENIQIDIEGLLYDEEFSKTASSLLTVLANDLIISYLNDNSLEIGAAVSPTIQDIINEIIQQILAPTTINPELL